MNQPLDQEERLLQFLIDKNNEIAGLKATIRKNDTPDTLRNTAGQKFTWLWALTEHLGNKYVKCPKCKSKTKPVSAPNGFFLMVCKNCGHYLPTKKDGTLNAYE